MPASGGLAIPMAIAPAPPPASIAIIASACQAMAAQASAQTATSPPPIVHLSRAVRPAGIGNGADMRPLAGQTACLFTCDKGLRQEKASGPRRSNAMCLDERFDQSQFRPKAPVTTLRNAWPTVRNPGVTSGRGAL